MSESADVAIVGAGMIGLSIAFELAGRGASVRVYDRGEPAGAASWAGAGMLAPYTETANDDTLMALCAASLDEYPRFVERVRAAGGVDPRLHLDGIVHAGFGETHLARLRQRAAAIRQGGIECQVLDRTQTLAAEPWLGAHVSGGMFVAAEGYIDNRLLGRALVAACRQLGVAIASVGSLAVECDARRVLGVHTDMGYAPAGAVVNAAGAWAAAVPGIPASSRPPVVPRKGQMLALETPIGFVRHATWVPNGYLVPRDDGRLLVGATDEQAGFDLRTTAGGIAALLDAALTAAPALAGFTVSETWAGLRPGSGDGRPFIGPAPLDGLFVATGHYRNGILLAPITARLVAECVDGRIAGALAAFSLVRAAAEMETPLRGKNEAI